jgi:uncharacterized lipoprotein YmbA
MRRTTSIVLVMLVSGCGFLSRKENHFYSLQTTPRGESVRAASGLPIGIDAIELPPGIDRREIVVRGANQELEMRGTHQWASPIEEMVMHTLAFDLANRLPDGMVVLPGQAKPVGAMRSVSVVFEDLAVGADRVFVLDARWTIGDVTRRERITVEAASLESADVAKAMSSALATLAERMAASL